MVTGLLDRVDRLSEGFLLAHCLLICHLQVAQSLLVLVKLAL